MAEPSAKAADKLRARDVEDERTSRIEMDDDQEVIGTPFDGILQFPNPTIKVHDCPQQKKKFQSGMGSISKQTSHAPCMKKDLLSRHRFKLQRFQLL